MKKILYSLLILPLFMNAQAVCHDGHDDVKPSDVSGKNVDGNSQLISVSTRNSSIKGSPYAFKDWCKCEVVAIDNSISKYDKVQFDIEKNQILIYSNGIPSTIPINQIISFSVIDKNTTRQFTTIDKSNFTEEGTESKIYEVFSDNNYLIKEIVKYVQTSSDDSGKMFYKKRTSYFVLNNSGKYKKTKLSKKHLLKTLKDKEKDVLKYIKENKLSYKEKDVSEILAFYHSLT